MKTITYYLNSDQDNEERLTVNFQIVKGRCYNDFEMEDDPNELYIESIEDDNGNDISGSLPAKVIRMIEEKCTA